MKIQFDNGHSVDFETQPSDSDIEEAYKHTQTLPPPVAQPSKDPMAFLEDTKKQAMNAFAGFPDQINAGVEAGVNTGMGMLGSVTTGPLAFGTNLLNTAIREGRLITPAEGEKAFNKGVGILTEPLMEETSPLGREYTDLVGKGMQELIPIIPLHGTMPSIRVGEGYNALKSSFPEKTKPTLSTIEKIRQEAAAKQPEVAPTTETPLADTRTGKQLSREAYDTAMREKQLQQQSAFNRPEQFPDMVQETPLDRMVRDLGGEPVPKQGVETPMTRMAEDLTAERSTPEMRAAQESVESRQAGGLDVDAVKRELALERGAKERQAQENAPTGYAEWVANRDNILRKQEAEQAALDRAKQETEQLAEGDARKEAAQRAIAERQAALEAEVKQQRHWDEETRVRQMGDNPAQLKRMAEQASQLFDEGGGVSHLRSGLTKDDFVRALSQLEPYISKNVMDVLLRPPEWKSRSRYVLMRPQEFLDLALKFGRGGPDVKRVNTIKTLFNSKSKLDTGNSTVPWLTLGEHKGKEFITGHEGRHRSTFFIEKGVEFIPVELRSDRIRWDQQKEKQLFDYMEKYPEKIATQDAYQKARMYGDNYPVEGNASRQFPLTREQAGEGGQFAFNKSGITELNSGIAPSLAEIGVTKKILDLFNNFRTIGKRPNVTSDPYLASTGNKAAHTRAFRAMYAEMEKQGLDPAITYQRMSTLADDPKSGITELNAGMNPFAGNRGSLPEKIASVERQIAELGRRYVGVPGSPSKMSFEDFSNANYELIGQKISLENQYQKYRSGVPAKSVEEVHPGYKVIPHGTTIIASHGLTYKEPTRGTVVGTYGFRMGDKAYNLPIVDFGDGHGRKVLPGDIKKIFGGPKDSVNLNSGMNPKQAMDALKKAVMNDKFEIPLEKSLDGAWIPRNPSMEAVIASALKEGKDSKLWTYTQSGMTNAALKSKSAAVQAAAEVIQNASKREDLYIRKAIFPAERHLKQLSRVEIEDLATLFKDEMFSGKRYDADVLLNNLSEKQLRAYVAVRDMFDSSLAQQNAARAAQGKRLITPQEAYLSSRWSGDFRRPIYEKVFHEDGTPKLDKDGKQAEKLVWYLADNTTRGLEKQTAALKEKFPDLVIDPSKDHRVRSSASRFDLESMYTKMLDILGPDDPAIAKIQQLVADQAIVEGEGSLGQKKHFLNKGNIRGFVGDRPGKTPRSEAIAMFQQQIQYAKNGAKWSEMQKAAEDIKALLASPELRTQQPNNVRLIREYFKNAAGVGEAAVTRAAADVIRNAGISPKILNDAVGNVKSFFILQKLGASAGFTIANVIQTANVIPYLTFMYKEGYKGNPATSILQGFPSGMAMGVYHYLKHMDPDFSQKLPSKFWQDAFDYAEQNGVTARSIVDESPITSSFGMTGKVANALGKTLSIPETFVRSTAFMTYAHMLKDSGKFTDPVKLFQKAEEMVNSSMVDYRSTERALMFNKAGGFGNFMNTLQTYPMNFYNNYALMFGRAKEGNWAPLLAMLTVHYTVAGFSGIPGFNDMDKLFKLVRDNALTTPQWKSVMDSPFGRDPKLWMMENMGKQSVYGPLSEATGVALTSRVAAPAGSEMIQAPGGVAVDVAKQAWALGKAVVDPTNKTKAMQAAMKILPTGLVGSLETSPLGKDITYTERGANRLYNQASDLERRIGVYERTPQETMMRKFGLKSQKEMVTSDIAYNISNQKMLAQEKGGKLIDPYYDALRTGDMKKANDLYKLHFELTGTDFTSEQLDAKAKREGTTRVERILESAASPAAKHKEIVNAARMMRILNKK